MIVAMADALQSGAIATVVGEVDRSQQVVPKAINRSFHAPRDFEEIDPYEDDPVTLRTLGLVPWIERRILGASRDHLARYADDGRFFTWPYPLQLSAYLVPEEPV